MNTKTISKVSINNFEPHPVGFGAGPIGGKYGSINDEIALEAVRKALELGINYFDTAPYYGVSEYRLGKALEALKDQFPRESYYISTKVGRYGDRREDFNFTASTVRQSIERSMERLKTEYLDIVICHDVEFVELDEVVGKGGALEALFQLRSEGKIRWIGISGYPLPSLLKIAQYQYEQMKPLDIVLSYCHYTLQNTLFSSAAPQFLTYGIRWLINASPIGMGLLRDNGPQPWHPASPDLLDACHKASAFCREVGVNLPQLAMKFAYEAVPQKFVTTLVGCLEPKEVECALESWLQVINRRAEGNSGESAVISNENERYALERVKSILAAHKDETWPSPPPNFK
ncbi:uncharacterized protein VTP21DRAFT_10690 [Calcarisporiella thermophila]|uniref:uncharacterized protein n=1 Tax=Calcarisporiella thermophila TaxID=911321 RepID=UPI00374413D8